MLHLRDVRALLAALALARCAPPSQVVQVAPGPAPGRPRFTLPATGRTLYGLAVVPCGGGPPRWQFGTDGGVVAAIPPTIVYGEVPTGFALLPGPAALTPGCYEVFVDGAAGRFTVQPDGGIAPATSARPGAAARDR
jgi:hypothetical protein